MAEDNEQNETDRFKLELLKLSWGHYQHLEILRKDHLNLFVVLNGAVLAIAGSNNRPIQMAEGSVTVSVLLMILSTTATLFYFLSRVNEESRMGHNNFINTTIQSSTERDNWNTSFHATNKKSRSVIGHLLNIFGLYNVTKLMLTPYLVFLALYSAVASTNIKLFQMNVLGASLPIGMSGNAFAVGAMFASGIGFAFCFLDYIQIWIRRDRHND